MANIPRYSLVYNAHECCQQKTWHINRVCLEEGDKASCSCSWTFLAGLAYLQYQQIVAISWNKIPRLLQNAANELANATTQIPGFSSDHTSALAMTNFGIPLTGSMAMGFAVGFMKG
ncbi:MAG: FUN14 domain-containing protein [Candidatus Nitrosopolaris sp.]